MTFLRAVAASIISLLITANSATAKIGTIFNKLIWKNISPKCDFDDATRYPQLPMAAEPGERRVTSRSTRQYWRRNRRATPLEVGYSLTRKLRERGYRREELTRFGRIPSHKATLIWLAARYAFVEKSILVVTEGLGERPFHGRVVLLVNEHTASAGEMVSAFAEENNLATIVGTKTPGRLLSGSAYKVGHGYILGLPVAAYLTWQGRMLENNGIVLKFSIELSREALKQGRDTQLGTAIEVAKAL